MGEGGREEEREHSKQRQVPKPREAVPRFPCPSLATRLPPPARALVLDTEIKCAVPIAITIHNIYYIKHTHTHTNTHTHTHTHTHIHTHTHTHTHTKHKYVIICIIYLFYIIYMRYTTNYTAAGDANSFTQ